MTAEIMKKAGVYMDINAENRKTAVKRLRDLAAPLTEEEAAALVDAALAAAVDQAFELINGSGPVPTSMTALKADQLRFVCDRLGRLLTQREVEVLFRITAASARSILTTMGATYAEDLRGKFLDRMRADCTVTASGNADGGLTWTLRFTERSTFDFAWTELTRLGLASEATGSPVARTITIPMQLTVDSTTVKPLERLEIPAPAEKKKR